jgi:glycolate oxidase iron-sulfur subunit
MVCPSGVHYGQLIDAVRAKQQAEGRHVTSGFNRFLLDVLSNRERLRRYTRFVPLLRHLFLLRLDQWIVSDKLKQLFKIAALLPGEIAHAGLIPAKHPPMGESLQLFIGCVSSQADQPVIKAATELLTKLGYAVEIPSHPTCCGALYRHNGFPEAANYLCEKNRKLTRNSRSSALLTLATACQLELLEQAASNLPIVNGIDFVVPKLKALRPELRLMGLPARVAVHVPCSARQDQTIRLLEYIPRLKIDLLPDNNLCCGAAGSYLFNQPNISKHLGGDKLNLLKLSNPDILVTTNTGCAIQFKLQIKQAKLDIEVLHPVELINRQLQHT